jgi:hypothetical protein
MKKFLPGIWALVGLLLGSALGVGYAWVIQPANFRGAEPSALQPVYRGEYILLIASAYQATGNLEEARMRLELFPELNPDALSSLAQQVVAAGGPADSARGLARLSVALRGATPSPSVAVALATPANSATIRSTGSLEPTLGLTIPFLPTATRTLTIVFTPTTASEFILVTKEQVCNPLIVPPLIQVIVQTPDGKGVPDVEILVQWEGGGGRFITGMKPELSPGYADFAIAPGKPYQISVGNGLTIVRDLTAPSCPGSTPIIGKQTPVTGGGTGSAFTGSWRLVFEMR